MTSSLIKFLFHAFVIVTTFVFGLGLAVPALFSLNWDLGPLVAIIAAFACLYTIFRQGVEIYNIFEETEGN